LIEQIFPIALQVTQDKLQPDDCAIVVVGGLISSMVLSLIVTPAVNFYLQQPAKHSAAPPTSSQILGGY
jgi:multidrug efflux pump subunit AcrB